MKRMAMLILTVALSVSVAGGAVASNAQKSETRTEEEAINAVIIAITDAFNGHDAKGWTRLATPDAQLVTIRGEFMNGVAEIERGLTALFQTRNRNASVKILDVKVKLIRPDVAMAHVTNELSGVIGPDGQRLAALIANSVASEDISYVESKHLLRILGELNDIEVIRLASHIYETYGSGEGYWEKHKAVLEPALPSMNSPQVEFDQATLQSSYDEHLTRLGLLDVQYSVDHRTKLPEFDSWTGAQKVNRTACRLSGDYSCARSGYQSTKRANTACSRRRLRQNEPPRLKPGR